MPSTDEWQLELLDDNVDSFAMGDIFLRYPELKPRGVPYSRQHLALLEEQGKFPRRVHLSDRVVAWKLSEILEWMRTRRGRE